MNYVFYKDNLLAIYLVHNSYFGNTKYDIRSVISRNENIMSKYSIEKLRDKKKLNKKRKE